MKKKFAILISLILLLSLPVVGLGAVTVDKIESYLASDMRFKVDEEYWQPRDLDGTVLYPIIYNGRFYVPARALLENKGVRVDYDAVERTIILDYPVVDIVSSNVPEPPTDLDLRKLDTGMSNRISMNSTTTTNRYEITFNNESPLNNLLSGIDLEFDLNNDTRIIINGKEISISDVSETGMTYLLEDGFDGRYIIETDKENKFIKLISFDGEEIKSTDEVTSGVVVNILKTKHDTAKNSVSNIR